MGKVDENNLDEGLQFKLPYVQNIVDMKVMLEKEYAEKERKALAKEKAKIDKDKPNKRAFSKKAKRVQRLEPRLDPDSGSAHLARAVSRRGRG